MDSIPMLNIVLPIGISFYTFLTMSYTIDIYRGKLTPCNSFKEFALFVAFFPHLVAGPILRASQFLPQLREKIENVNFHGNLRQVIIHNFNMKLGITIMAFGFLKKMFFADNIAPLVYDIFKEPIGLESFSIILGSLAFYLQLYGDFSGYTDIAIGAALILGFKFPINFNHPLFARSPPDFFRRWHITLFSWFRDYLYIPLGGSRKGKVRTYLNLLLVMLVAGLWHGASWNFVIWGFMIGTYLAIHRLISNRFPILKSHWFFSSKSGIAISIFITQFLIIFSAPAFRVVDFKGMMYSLQKFIFLDFATENTVKIILNHSFEVFLMVLLYVFSFVLYSKPNLTKRIAELKSSYWLVFILIIILGILFFYDGNPVDFVYFQF
jgi:alginate O-acetyltransferase complex protein AlgI